MKSATSQTSRTDSLSAWDNIRGILRKEYGEAVFNNWVSHLEFTGIEGSEIIMSAPTRFIREWISSNYSNRMLQLWKQEEHTAKKLTILVRQNQAKRTLIQNSPQESTDATIQSLNVLEMQDKDSNISSPLDRRFTFSNFIVGSSNKLAFSAAKSIAENKDIVNGNNPLFLHGGVGLGKTHLMHAVALHIRETQPERKVIYISAEKFMYQFIRALRDKSIMSFKEAFREVDVFMIDDIQFICDKESTQEEFFHTVNALLDMNKQIIISGDRSPADLDGMKERVRSRLGWGLVADINSSDFDLRLGILKSKVEQMKKVNVPTQVLEFLAGKIRSNIRELEGALNKVIAHATLVGEDITLKNTQVILSDLLRANERSITIAEIQKKVAKHFDIKIADMSSAKRARSVARPRQIAMYICKNHTMRSLSEIGRKFGGKDHTTVIHAVKKIEELMREDSEIKEDVENLIRSLN